MHKDSLFDQLRTLESEVANGERQLAAQEALVVALKREGRATSEAQATLDEMRKSQEIREEHRRRLLASLQP